MNFGDIFSAASRFSVALVTFNDIFKSSFLENVSAVSYFDMALALVLAFGLGLFIFLVYKKTKRNPMILPVIMEV